MSFSIFYVIYSILIDLDDKGKKYFWNMKFIDGFRSANACKILIRQLS
jgi:hypothetical protein